MDIRQVRYFLKVAEKGSFTAAAEHLGVAQPALGLQIRKLEDELQVQLLVRHARGVDLTDAGRLLVEHGQVMMAQFGRTRDALTALDGAARNRLVVGLAPSLGAGLAAALLERMRRERPALELKFVDGFSALLAEQVLEGRLDVAVGYDMSPAGGLTVRRLGADHLRLITPVSNAGAKAGPAEFAELGDWPLILPPAPHKVRLLVEEAARERKIALRIAHEVHTAPTALDLVETGAGAAVSGVAAFGPLMRGRKVAARPLVNPSPVFQFSLAHRADRTMTADMLHVISTLDDLLQSLIRTG